jgi:hypothetical protein
MDLRSDHFQWPFVELAGALVGVHRVAGLAAARTLGPVVARVWTTPLGPTAHASLRAAGLKLQTSSGAFQQIRGHVFEAMDVADYNYVHALLGDGHRLVLRVSSCARNYDASRFIDGRFAGGVQHKLGVDSIGSAIKRFEAWRPGTSSHATIRVPADRAEEAFRRYGDQVGVGASRVTTGDVNSTVSRGATEFRFFGIYAVSRGFQVAFAAVVGAAFSVAVGAFFDLLLDRSLTFAHFKARRRLDALGGAVTAVVVTVVGLTGPGGIVFALVVSLVVCLSLRPVRRSVNARYRPELEEPRRLPVRRWLGSTAATVGTALSKLTAVKRLTPW